MEMPPLSIFETLFANFGQLCEPSRGGHWCEPTVTAFHTADSGTAERTAENAKNAPVDIRAPAAAQESVSWARQSNELRKNAGRRIRVECAPPPRDVYETFFTMKNTPACSNRADQMRTPESTGGVCRRGQGISEVLGSRLGRYNEDFFRIETRDILTVASKNSRLDGILAHLARDTSGVDGRLSCRSRSNSPFQQMCE